jgi:hypothetical protein
LAKVLAIRDRRVDEEVAMLDEQYLLLSQLFDEAVLSFGVGTRRPLNQVPAIPMAERAPNPQAASRQRLPQGVL